MKATMRTHGGRRWDFLTLIGYRLGKRTCRYATCFEVLAEMTQKRSLLSLCSSSSVSLKLMSRNSWSKLVGSNESGLSACSAGVTRMLSASLSWQGRVSGNEDGSFCDTVWLEIFFSRQQS